jgi:hypothetical protein
MTDVIVGQPNGPGNPAIELATKTGIQVAAAGSGSSWLEFRGVLAPAVAPFMELVLLRNHRGVRNLATFAEAITEHLRTAHPQSVDRDLAEPKPPRGRARVEGSSRDRPGAGKLRTYPRSSRLRPRRARGSSFPRMCLRSTTSEATATHRTLP